MQEYSKCFPNICENNKTHGNIFGETCAYDSCNDSNAFNLINVLFPVAIMKLLKL